MPSKVNFKSSLKIDKRSKKSRKETFKASFSFPGKGNLNVIFLMPQTIQELGVCLLPYVHPIPYPKFIKYEDLPDASGWEDDDAVMKPCGPNWCKDAPNSNVSTSLEQAIQEKKRQLGFDEMYDEDPYLQEMVLHNLCMVSIFGCNKPLDYGCKQKLSCMKTNCVSQMFEFLRSVPLIKHSLNPIK